MSRRRTIHPTFEFVETEEQAKIRCKELRKGYTPYMMDTYGAPHYTPWTSKNEDEHKFCIFYYYRA